MQSFRLSRVATMLFFSGMCALVYQVAWFRELRLIFGASTASSAAVLAVFMAGLGFGGARLGKLADKVPNALLLYGNLELSVAVLAGITPLLVMASSSVYLAAGGSTTLGTTVATLLRLVLSVLVLGPSTFLMGGTLPAAARAVEREGDGARRRIATLYGVNTLGAVVGALLANFALLEVLGTRSTLWAAALVNALVAVFARALSRSPSSRDAPIDASTMDAVRAAPQVKAVSELVPWFPPVAAALAGGVFMLMELTWYRMLAPILGGSSYTFGLILAVALVGIGVGGALYARGKTEATLRAFAATCALEAVFIAIPFALGDRLALFTGSLRPLSKLSFGSSVMVWAGVASFVVLPAAIVSGLQFPLVIGLYGRGGDKVGRDVGNAYLANTLGAIVGSLAGGFGLIPMLGAVGCWRLSVIMLALGSGLALALDSRHRVGARRDGAFFRGMALTVLGLLLVAGTGPTGVWRHSGIGAGRADGYFESGDPNNIKNFIAYFSRDQEWEKDGVESSVALGRSGGYSFIVNGKSDGHSTIDSGTQVMSGLLPALLHPAPKSTLVVGLGTGSTAGWLASIPSMERVDVVELEPAILEVARACAPVNKSVLDNPKIHIQLADAREVLRTTPSRYDIVFSEPSNPYRAGISSMYTIEYYKAVRERLLEGGFFVQWLQAYEVDAWAVSTAITTIRQVFGAAEIWETEASDLVVVATVNRRPPADVARIRERLKEEPFLSATRSVWYTESLEGLLAHYVANTALSDAVVQNGLGAINTDDQNLLEFAFARSVGKAKRVDTAMHAVAARMNIELPPLSMPLEPETLIEERWLSQAMGQRPLNPLPSRYPTIPLGKVLDEYRRGRHTTALAAWKKLERKPRSYAEGLVVSEMAARVGVGADLDLIELGPPSMRDLLRGIALARTSDLQGASESLTRGFVLARKDPWTLPTVMHAAIEAAGSIGIQRRDLARPLFDVLSQPLAVDLSREHRLDVLARLAFLTGDPNLCASTLEKNEPPRPRKDVLEMRLHCYRLTKNPLAARAEDDLVAYLELTAEFGAGIKASAPAPTLAPLPPPTAAFGAGHAAGAGAGVPAVDAGEVPDDDEVHGKAAAPPRDAAAD